MVADTWLSFVLFVLIIQKSGLCIMFVHHGVYIFAIAAFFFPFIATHDFELFQFNKFCKLESVNLCTFLSRYVYETLFFKYVCVCIDWHVSLFTCQTCLAGAGSEGKHTALEAVTIVLDLPPPQPGLGLVSVDRVSASDPKSALALQRLVQAAVRITLTCWKFASFYTDTSICPSILAQQTRNSACVTHKWL